MPLIIFSGWEWGWIDNTFAFNNEGTHDGSPSIVSGAWAGSPYSLRINPSGAAAQDYNFSAIGPLGNLVQANVPTSYHRFDFKYEVKPTVNYEFIFRQDNVNAAAAKGGVVITSAGTLGVLNRSNVLLQTGTTVIPQSTRTTLYYKIGTGAAAPYEVRIGSSTATPELSGTGDFGTINGGEVRVGKVFNLNGNSVDFYYDNYCWRDDFYPPPGICVMLVPVADGFYANGTPNGAVQLWQCVDEIPSDGDASYINGLTAGQAYTALVSPAPFGLINYVASFVSWEKDGTNNMLSSVRLRSGSTDSDTTPANANNYNVFRKFFETDPATGLAWTQAGVSNAQVGIIQTDANPARLTSAYIMVDYQPSSTGAGDQLLQFPNYEQDDSFVPRPTLAKTKSIGGTTGQIGIQLVGTIKKVPPSSPFTDPRI
jgi:hypothetical protein